jgi:hypothetical protein
MMLISSISDVDWCCCKWIEIAVDLEVSNGPGLALGPQKSMIFGLIVADLAKTLTRLQGARSGSRMAQACAQGAPGSAQPDSLQGLPHAQAKAALLTL